MNLVELGSFGYGENARRPPFTKEVGMYRMCHNNTMDLLRWTSVTCSIESHSLSYSNPRVVIKVTSEGSCPRYPQLEWLTETWNELELFARWAFSNRGIITVPPMQLRSVCRGESIKVTLFKLYVSASPSPKEIKPCCVPSYPKVLSSDSLNLDPYIG